MSDLERELRAALHDDAASVTGGLVLPGDPGAADERTDEVTGHPRGLPSLTRRRVRQRGRTRGVGAAAAAVAASVALVAGAVWGADHLQRPAPVLPAGYEHTRQVHGPADIPEALRLVPEVVDTLHRLAPVEDAAIARCMRTQGFTDLPPVVEYPLWVERFDLTASAAARDGYGTARALAGRRAFDGRVHDWESRHQHDQDRVNDALYGGEGSVRVWVGEVPFNGGDVPYGGCLASTRRDLWGDAEYPRLLADLGAFSGLRDPRALGGRPVTDRPPERRVGWIDRDAEPMASARRRWAACMDGSGVRHDILRLPGLREAYTGPAPFFDAPLDDVLDARLDAAATGVGEPIDPTTERRIAVADVACTASSGYGAAFEHAWAGSWADLAMMMRRSPRLVDDVFTLADVGQWLLRAHGLATEARR